MRIRPLSQPERSDDRTADDLIGAIWDLSDDAMALSDADGTVLAANQRYYALYGLTPEQVIGQNFAVIFPSEARAGASERYRQAFHNPAPPPAFQSVVRRGDGSLGVVESRVRYIAQGGQRQAMLSIIRDITEQHRAQEQARRFVSLVERSADFIATAGPDGRLTFVNTAGRALVGLPEAGGPALTLAELCAPATWAELRAQLGHPGRGWRGEGRLRHQRTHEPIEVELTLFEIDSGIGADAPGLALIVRDIRARKRAEALLRESEARFRSMADTAPVLIWMSGLDKGCDYFNQPWLTFTGRSFEQECGVGWTEGIHPDDLVRCLSTYEQSFDARAPFSMQYRLRRADGSYRWMLDIGIPRRTPQGEFVGYIGSCVDITEQRQLLEREQQARAEAEAALGQRDNFFSLAAHELKTPLTSLLGNVQMLQRRAARDPALLERYEHNLSVIRNQGQRLAAMINRLLDVARLELGQLALERGTLDLRALLLRVVDEIQPALERHSLSVEGADSVLVVEGDEVRLEQVLQNLIQNAVKYSPQGGPVRVRLERAGTWARIAVQDEGIGVPAEALPHLFTRFYRADNAARHAISGTGIGLHVVKEIVSLHGGTVAAASVEGRGSTFTVSLPLREAGPAG